MIAHLHGILAECDLTEVVVDVQGVGYHVSVPMSTYDRLPRQGETVHLLTHLQVREDLMQLFGFATREERQLFLMLLDVTGIGPRLALNILSCMSVERFAQALVAEDLKALGKINGIGKRSAERLVVELREKIKRIAPAAGFAAPAAALPADAQDAVSALETLGFKTDAARKVVQAICAEAGDKPPTAENLIRKALAKLNS
ncbi:MAG: Holliday junction branch migration protein RuvA [Lentisphaeria bacterium]|nr:Holliday junction branch migration protein RuvA [Lentisphaeria bacterium]